MQTLSLTWNGEEYPLKLSFDLFMRIEEKVSFARIAQAVQEARLGNPAELPMSHVTWVVYCCLRDAGVPVRTPAAVHEPVVTGGFKYGALIGELIVAYYDAQPQKPPKKNGPETPPNPSRPSGRRSRSSTG